MGAIQMECEAEMHLSFKEISLSSFGWLIGWLVFAGWFSLVGFLPAKEFHILINLVLGNLKETQGLS